MQNQHQDGAAERRPDADETSSGWPKAIGVISLVYAIAGLCFTCLGTAMAFVSEQMMAMGGMEVEVPLEIKIVAVAMGAIAATLGVVMLVGAVGLLRRRRSGVAWLKRWAVMRILLIVVNVAVAWATAPMQMEMQRGIMEAQNDMLRERGMDDRVTEVTDEALWRKVMIPTAIISVLASIYPAFLGLYLSRRRIEDEIRSWD